MKTTRRGFFGALLTCVGWTPYKPRKDVSQYMLLDPYPARFVMRDDGRLIRLPDTYTR